MAMMMDYGLLGEDGAAQSKKNLKMVGCIVCALAAGVMLGGAISGYNTSNPEVTEMAGISTMPVSNSRLRAPRLDTLRNPAFSSPIAKLALTSLKINERMNRDGRGITTKAASELGAGWELVDEEMKGKLKDSVEGMKFKKRFFAGVTAPMNYFDPLGFSTQTSTGKLLFYREVELKHGRVAMLASLGFVVGEQFHPLFGGEIDSPAIYAFQETPLQTFWQAVVTALALPEIFSVFTFAEPGSTAQGLVKNEQWAIKADHIPGDLGFDPLGLKPKDEDELIEMQTKELNNGRLAMIAIAGMVAQELVTGDKLFS
jgi:hypothetical protein